MRISDWSSDVCSSDLPLEATCLEESSSGVLDDSDVHGVPELLVDRLVARDGGIESIERDALELGSLPWCQPAPGWCARDLGPEHAEIGRPSCRECRRRYVLISVVAV